MAKPFTRENAKAMALRSSEARKRNRERAAQFEQGLREELGYKPFTRQILAYFDRHPEAMREIIVGQVKKAQRGDTRAFNAIVDRTDGPVFKEPEKRGPQVIVVSDWQRPLEERPEGKSVAADSAELPIGDRSPR